MTLIPFPAERSHIMVDNAEVDGMRATATFDRDRIYRYKLTRVWNPNRPPLGFLMLNPSKATAEVSDPTVTRCMGYARRNGYGGLVVLNIFALRSTDPRVLYSHRDPIGPLNDECILRETLKMPTVCAWGAHGKYRNRGPEVAAMLAEADRMLLCLKVTKDGHPGHPLYLRADAPLMDYRP